MVRRICEVASMPPGHPQPRILECRSLNRETWFDRPQQMASPSSLVDAACSPAAPMLLINEDALKQLATSLVDATRFNESGRTRLNLCLPWTDPLDPACSTMVALGRLKSYVKGWESGGPKHILAGLKVRKWNFFMDVPPDTRKSA